MNKSKLLFSSICIAAMIVMLHDRIPPLPLFGLVLVVIFALTVFYIPDHIKQAPRFRTFLPVGGSLILVAAASFLLIPLLNEGSNDPQRPTLPATMGSSTVESLEDVSTQVTYDVLEPD